MKAADTSDIEFIGSKTLQFLSTVSFYRYYLFLPLFTSYPFLVDQSEESWPKRIRCSKYLRRWVVEPAMALKKDVVDPSLSSQVQRRFPWRGQLWLRHCRYHTEGFHWDPSEDFQTFAYGFHRYLMPVHRFGPIRCFLFIESSF